jgi:hypothetical protein
LTAAATVSATTKMITARIMRLHTQKDYTAQSHRFMNWRHFFAEPTLSSQRSAWRLALSARPFGSGNRARETKLTMRASKEFAYAGSARRTDPIARIAFHRLQDSTACWDFAIPIGNPALTKAFLALLIKPDSGTRRCFTITKPVPMHSGQSRSDGLMTGFFIYFFSVCGAGNPFNSQNIALMSLSRSGSSRRPRY